MIRLRGCLPIVAACAAVLALAGCGGGGGGSTASTTVESPPPVTAPPVSTSPSNVAPVVVDGGPAALGTAARPTYAVDLAFVSVTLCAPGGRTCQVLDHVLVDTGSVGLRVAAAALTPELRAALPVQVTAAGAQVAECYAYVDGYVFGAVHTADTTIAGETVAAMPLQVIGEDGPFATVPQSCSAGGGSSLTTVSDLQANGILGVGTTATDCGALCAQGSGDGSAIYYGCSASACTGPIARASATSAPFEQTPNFVAALPVDNTGSILQLDAPAPGGSATVGGALIFGVGTQSNNGLGGATVIPTTASGRLTVTYKGQAYSRSYIDSGTNFYLLTDSSIPQCTDANRKGFYCPAAPLRLNLTVSGVGGASADGGFTLYNAASQLTGGRSAVPGVAIDPTGFSNLSALPNNITLGLQFFYGRRIYTVIQGRSAGGATGPFVAY